MDAYKGPLLSYNATSAKRVRPDRIEPDFDKLRQGYPNVQGEANVVSPIAMIQWPIEKGKFFGAGLLQRCSEAATFKVLAKSSKQGLID
ncbi:hypothetical protein K1X12_04625 [Hyphomonas sp. WL0036]|uniref:hypothetical protein n=1 Tax=Hyphomonas sediminis TaxID=2866160 RepID=UPI001C8193BF|nr:hypothetical protein [Hyphomonas sediminis]MBY9066170.1 hypothetical protein [Hyphomonas sediminis]